MTHEVNKVILVDNVSGDPETRYMPSDSAVTNIAFATSKNWKGKQIGRQQEHTRWHCVVFLSRLAEVVGEYLRRGPQVYIRDSLCARKWQGQDGQNRYTTKIAVDINSNMQLLNGRPPGNDLQRAPYGPMRHPQQAPQQQSCPAPQQQPTPQSAQDCDSFDDDVPF